MQRSITHPNGVVTYTFDSLKDHPVHAHVSTRHGGVSPAPWNTLNFSVLRGDTRERVEENRRRFAEAVGVNPAHVTHARQV
jgi:copper oxidase (laccase) domain-containing protein